MGCIFGPSYHLTSCILICLIQIYCLPFITVYTIGKYWYYFKDIPYTKRYAIIIAIHCSFSLVCTFDLFQTVVFVCLIYLLLMVLNQSADLTFLTKKNTAKGLSFFLYNNKFLRLMLNLIPKMEQIPKFRDYFGCV